MKQSIKIFSGTFTCIATGFLYCSCGGNPAEVKDKFDVNKQLSYCDTQIKRTINQIPDSCLMPRSMNNDESKWHTVNIYDWTSGFWPGILWYNYENTGNEVIKEKAIRYTECLEPLSDISHIGDHDIGFQLFCSYGNAYRITGKKEYRDIILNGAEKLSKLYNPVAGTILSWPNMVQKMGWPHNTIMDNMMNLEILFWAAKNGGDEKYYNIALSHAKKTKETSFRNDGSNYHVSVYDTVSGNFVKGVTNQGIHDESMWARGQAWAIYGFTMVYRETKDKEFLRFAEKAADLYLKRLPEDDIPFWDFDDPAIPDAPKDASAAAITASALLELSQLEDNKEKAEKYVNNATNMLKSLSSENYQSRKSKPSFLMHCTGNYPGGYEIDASINYGDYYYIEALYRYKRIISGASL
jgi:unsaturated chondroitin disaccharide hydrolase